MFTGIVFELKRDDVPKKTPSKPFLTDVGSNLFGFESEIGKNSVFELRVFFRFGYRFMGV